ncbi:hypothetical protein [Actinomadura luteofluorescens]|uniref:hypothetical protein n=1 Tax=Actinomadura luteofluorescens TaxID=46163 RepID=UPI003D89FA51
MSESKTPTPIAEPLTDERLTEIRERERAATPKPWTASLQYPHVCWIGADPGQQIISANLSERPAEDIAFTAAARQDVPALLGEVDRLRTELAAVIGENNRLAATATQVEADRNILRTEQAAVFAALRDALGTSPATVGQAAVQAVKAIEERDTARALLAEAAAEVIRKVIADLEITPCSFWACDGPDKPFVSMKTCRVCSSVQELRKLLAALDGTEAVKS